MRLPVSIGDGAGVRGTGQQRIAERLQRFAFELVQLEKKVPPGPSRRVDLRWIAPRREDKQQRAAHSLEDFTARVLRGRQSRVRRVRVHQSCPLVGSVENPTGRDSSGRSGRGVMVRRRSCHGIDEDGWPAKFLQHYRPALSRSASFSERSGPLGAEEERDRPIWL